MERVTLLQDHQDQEPVSKLEQVTRSVGDSLGDLIQVYDYCMQKVLAKYGLYSGQPEVLFAVEKAKTPTQNELALMLNISKASVGVSLRRMEKAGFVKRVRDKKDVRCIRISLTKRGEEYARFCRLDYDMIHSNMLGTMDYHQREAVLNTLEELKRGLLELKQRIEL